MCGCDGGEHGTVKTVGNPLQGRHQFGPRKADSEEGETVIKDVVQVERTSVWGSDVRLGTAEGLHPTIFGSNPFEFFFGQRPSAHLKQWL